MLRCALIAVITASHWTTTMHCQTLAPEIIAHRGASFDAPENTLAAFNLAWKQNADGIEGDFRLTADGRIVCCHDATTKRTGDKNLEVGKSTVDELRQVDVGQRKGAAWKSERIPLIDEVLAAVPAGKKIYVEIYTPETVPILKRVIDRTVLRPEQVVVISFQSVAVAAAKKTLPRMKAFWIVSLRPDKKSGQAPPSAAAIVAVLKKAGADGVDCSGEDTIDAAFVKTIRDGGFEFHVWTVDEADKARRFAALGVDSITTNRPQWIREQLAKPPRNGTAR